ncbi:MAG: hypothetical protein ACRD1C_11675 [Terriglobales bacterium]
MQKWVASWLWGVALSAGAIMAAPQTAQIPAGPTEVQSLKSLVQIFNDSNSQPATFDNAVEQFQQQFPHSSRMIPVLVLAVRYHRLRREFLPELRYGVAALRLDPHDLYVMSSLGQAIPDNVSPSDLNVEQLLTQAEGYDQQVLAAVQGFQITPGGLDFAGIHYSETNAHRLSDNLAGPAYISLGAIAMLRQQYPAAASAYRKALTYQPDAGTQAQTYYHIGAAEAAAHQNDAAKADLAKARSLAPSSQLLQRLIQAEEAKLSGGN